MRNTIILLILLAMGLGCKKSAPTEESKPFNILWIVSDDLGVDLGAYGNPYVHTPNLDKLASESVRYTNLNTVTAVCSPSRSSLITGMYPVTLNVHQHRTRFKNPLPKGIVPITSYFKEAGYFVTNGNGKKDSRGGKTDYNFKYDAKEMYQGGHWSTRPKGSNFFSQIQIFMPHRPFHEDRNHPITADSLVLPPYYADHPLLKKDWALYLETVQLVDQRVGEIMKSLKEEGILENTVVFFFGDQGRPHLRAKQFLYNSGTNTPLMVRWPDGKGAGTVSNVLVSNIDIPVASMHLAGIEVPDHLQGMNFLDESKEREYLFTMRDRRDETVDRIRAVRDKQFKYIKNYYPDRPYTQPNVYKDMRYPARPLMKLLYKQGALNEVQRQFMGNERPAEELYDLTSDPHEVHNLANDPAYHDQLLQYRQVLTNWVNTNDKGIYPEDEKEIDAAHKEAMRRKALFLKKRGLPEDYTEEDMVGYWMRELKI